MTGDHPDQLVQVQGIIQYGQCTGSVAYRVAPVFVRRQVLGPAHPGAVADASIVHPIHRADGGRRTNAHPTAQPPHRGPARQPRRAARTIRHPSGSTRRSPHMATEPASPELLDAAAEITGRRIVGTPLAGGGRAQLNVAMVRLKRWALQQQQIHERR